MLIANTQVALAGVVHALVLRTFGALYSREATVFQLVPQSAAGALEAAADDLKAGRAWQSVEAAKDAWRGRLPLNQGDWLPWLIDLPQAELIDLLALCGALTVNALPAAGVSCNASALAAAVGLDMSDWWEASERSAAPS
jgi:ParB family chromosome partitioning protein